MLKDQVNAQTPRICEREGANKRKNECRWECYIAEEEDWRAEEAIWDMSQIEEDASLDGVEVKGTGFFWHMHLQHTGK